MRLNKTLLLISIFATLIIGCEDDTQKLTLKDARKAVMSQYDLAVKKFKELLQLAPNEYNGLWGLADVEGKQGNYVEQENFSTKFSQTRNTRRASQRFLPALEENYVMQGNNLLGADVKKAGVLPKSA